MPLIYAVQPPNLLLASAPDQAYSADFWYYALPTELGPNTVLQFPSDIIVVEYTRLRANEWIR